jgi:hypothetical protein
MQQDATRDKRFGKNSLTHYELLPKKQYVQNNPNKIYEFEECDTLSDIK